MKPLVGLHLIEKSLLCPYSYFQLFLSLINFGDIVQAVVIENALE